MEFLKKNWLNIFLTVLATKLFESLYTRIEAIDWWAPLVALKVNPSFQAFVLSCILPVLFIGLYYWRWKYDSRNTRIAFELALSGLLIGYLIPFMGALLTGNLEPLIADMRADPFSKVVLFLFVVIFIGKNVLFTIFEGQLMDEATAKPVLREPDDTTN